MARAETGHVIARSALRNPDAGVLPVGYLDDDPDLDGKHMGNLRVFGDVESMERAVAETGAEALLITMPRASGKAVRRVVDAAMALGLAVRTVPPINDLLDGTLDAHRVRSRPGRGPAPPTHRRPSTPSAVREIIDGRTVADHRRRRVDRIRACPTGPSRSARAGWSSSIAPKARST